MPNTMQLLELAPNFSVWTNIDPGWEDSSEEFRFMYKEIFEDRCYDTAISLPDNAFIIDVGANIGLFSLYAAQKYPQCEILAFEPAPRSFELLRKNLQLHRQLKSHIRTYQCALGAESGKGLLTYYPNLSGSSTLFPDDKDNLRPLLEGVFGPVKVQKLYDDAQEVCIVTERLSRFLDDNCREGQKPQIDLLKIDVEGAELQVLKGIDERHWDWIQNVVMESSNDRGSLGEVQTLLKSKGFKVKVETTEWSANIEALLQAKGFQVNKDHDFSDQSNVDESGMFMVTASRPNNLCNPDS